MRGSGTASRAHETARRVWWMGAGAVAAGANLPPVVSDTALSVFAVAVAGLLGLVVGSFLNVVVARVPERRSLVRPPSACPACGAPVKPYDNIPVVSWLLLRGRCRACGAPISVQYPVVEALTGVLFAAVVWRFGLTWEAALSLVLVAVLVPLGVIDLQILKLPNPIVAFGAVSGAVLTVTASAATGEWNRLRDAAISAVALGGFFYLVAVLSLLISGRQGMGMGDVKLSFVLGLYLGWLGPRYVVVGMLLAFFSGAVVGVALIAARRHERRQPIPFGVFLAAGSILGLFVSPAIAGWYIARLG